MPVSGKVLEVNDLLEETPEVINSDPFREAWMLKIELLDPSELDTLMDAAAYEAYCQEREH
jgi:glycine cleavage system H protein